MKLTFDIIQLATEVFSDLCEKHNFTLVRSGESEFSLERQDYTLTIGVDYDGVYASFFESGSQQGFDLLAYLLRYRREKLTFVPNETPVSSHREYVTRQFLALKRHLDAGADDILAGDDGWKKTYKLPYLKREIS